jgi:hypothetical protein
MRQAVAGTNFASTTPDQWNLTFPSEVGRAYMVHAYAVWRGTVDATVGVFTLYVNGVVQIAMGFTNAVAATATYAETAVIATYAVPNVTNPACPLRLQSARAAGTGTIQLGTWVVAVYDMGSTANLPALDMPEGGFGFGDDVITTHEEDA